MAKINITHTSSGTITTPASGSTVLFYDSLDQVLKQKDETGFISIIGTSGYTGVTQFSELGGVAITTPVEGDLLVYSSGTLVNIGTIANLNATNIIGASISGTSILSDSIDSLVLLSGGTDLGEIFQTIGSDPTLAFVPGSSGSNNAQQNNSTCTASGDFSVAMCKGASSDGVASLAIGFDCVSNSDYSFAGGYQSATNGLTSFVHSTNSFCIGDRSVIIGGQNIIGTTDDTVYVPTIEIVNSGSTDSQIIMTDKADGLRYNVQLSGGTFIVTSL